ncbi:acyl-CoA dehydrogenase family protein [Gordonia sp. NPDC127522]|uniref:acyl-CoA dehydrogenase family protein n=1 Tax=Gordonia sp. NPDC127522 TaxID=3345390 RepID=UPI00362683B3
MHIDLGYEAKEFGVQAARAFDASGGDSLAVLAAANPAGRIHGIEQTLGALGAFDLRPLEDPTELEAAAALCRASGMVALPYPVAERLCRITPELHGLIVVSDNGPAGPVADIDMTWLAVTIDGYGHQAQARSGASIPPTEGFTAQLDLDGPEIEVAARAIALGIVLPCWTLLGMMERAIDLTKRHALLREQFDRPLAHFQSVRFQLTDAEVEYRGVDTLARYALWSIQNHDDNALADALAVRLAAVEAADLVFRTAHQIHGATGFCDESTLSWLSRYSLSIRRLPFGRSETEALLTEQVGRRGIAGLFTEPAGA